MVVSKRAVKEFLDQADDLRDSARAKKFTNRALNAKLVKMKASFLTKPYKHQKVCFLLGWLRKSYLFLLGMGSGKTKISLDLVRNLIRQRKASRALVLVPNVPNIDAWIEEANFHASDLSVVGITMAGETARTEAMLNAGQVIVMTYQGFVQLLSKSVPAKGKKKKQTWKPDDTKIRQAGRVFDVLICDEITAIKNHQSLHFRIVRKLARKIEYRYGLTGTPFDKNPLDLWSQFYVIDRGEALGPTLGLFRETFFTSKPRYWGGTDYTFRKRLKGNLTRRMRHSSIRYREEECQDLPACVGGIDGEDWMLRPVVFPSENWRYYEKLLEELEDARSSYKVMEAVYTRMRMLASGYLAATDDAGTKIKIPLKENPKLDALLDLLREIPEQEKVVVVNIFHKSGDLIGDALFKNKFSYTRIYGKTSNKDGMLEKWRREARILVASESIAYGLNLQRDTKYMIFFESPDSAIVRKQMERRIRRQGAKGRRCYYYDLVVRGSIEMRILKAVRDGKRLLDLLMDKRVSAGELMLAYKKVKGD